MMPAFAIFYILLILPFFPDDGKGRVENILFWPILAALVLTLVFQNRAQIDFRFFRSAPIVSLIAYLVFAAASVTWAFSPDYAFSRVVVQVLALIVVVVPYALPARGKDAIPGVYHCYVLALAVSAVYVLTTPPSPIGHPGYFTHKQELGLLAAIGIILSSYEILQRGWRRLVALVTIVLGFWLVFESESKSALAFAIIALVASWLMLMVCKRTRLTPAFIVAAIVVVSMFVANPIERLGYRLYGDACPVAIENERCHEDIARIEHGRWRSRGTNKVTAQAGSSRLCQVVLPRLKLLSDRGDPRLDHTDRWLRPWLLSKADPQRNRRC